MEEPYIIKVNSDPSCHLFFVKTGTDTVIQAGVTEVARSRASDADFIHACQEVHGDFDFAASAALLLPEGLPVKDGYYTVDSLTGICLGKEICGDYLHRGHLTHKCKHAWAAFIFSQNEVGRRTWVTSFIGFIRNRERSSLPQQRNDVLFTGSETNVIALLKTGVKSLHSATAPVSGDQFEEVPVFLRLACLADLLTHVNLIPLASEQDEPDEVTATSALLVLGRRYVVTEINGGESAAYFCKVNVCYTYI